MFLGIWNWMFRGGLAMATLGVVWSLWPVPGARAYANVGIGRSRYRAGPRVSIDLGHFNDSPADARFLGLAGLLTWDGYRVSRSRQPLVPEFLKDVEVLVIGNAMPYPQAFERLARAVKLDGRAVFAAEEVDAVRDWVNGGGSLLLEAAAPGPAEAAGPLAREFGLWFRECPAPVYSVVDTGREGHVAMLARGWIEAAPSVTPVLIGGDTAGCVARKAVAVRMTFGSGRVVALAAQLERDEEWVRRTGVDPRVMDNRSFLLAIMHWLSRG